MKKWKDHVFPSAPFPTEVQRRAFLKCTGAGLGGVALSPFLAALNEAMAADSCETVPADKSAMDYTFTAAYAASPPAMDEVAFTMEAENLMALTYGGDFMQYKPVAGQSPGVCVADMGGAGQRRR